MKKSTAAALTAVLGLAAFIIIFREVSLKKALAALQNSTPALIGTYIIVSLAIMTCLTLRWHLIIRWQGNKHIPFYKTIAYYFCGYAVSYVTPGPKIGGEPIKAAMLTKHNIPFRKAATSIAIDKSIELSTSAIFFVVGIIITLISIALPNSLRELLIILAAIILLAAGYYYKQILKGKDFLGSIYRGVRLHKTKKGKKWYKELQAFEAQIIKFYNHDRKDFYLAVTLSAIAWLLMIIEYATILAMLGIYQPTFAQLFLIITMIGAAYLIPTPMALGSLEAGQVGLFTLIALPAAAGAGVAIVTRIKDITISIAGFMALFIHTFTRENLIKEVMRLPKNITKKK